MFPAFPRCTAAGVRGLRYGVRGPADVVGGQRVRGYLLVERREASGALEGRGRRPRERFVHQPRQDEIRVGVLKERGRDVRIFARYLLLHEQGRVVVLTRAVSLRERRRLVFNTRKGDTGAT